MGSIFRLTRIILMLVPAVVIALQAHADSHAKKMHSVMVSQIVEHPALDAVRNGLRDGLKDAGYHDGKNLKFVYQTAQGNPATAVQIARNFVGRKPDVLVGIATPTAQALVAATKDIPIIFSAVTDPVGAKLLQSLESPGGNVTGLSDMSPITQQLRMIRQILPNATTIGLVYNPGEANSNSLINTIEANAPAMGFNIVKSVANSSAQVQSATQNAAAKSDVIFALTDNTTTSAFDAMIKAANDAQIPIYGSTKSHVEKGAVAAVGFDYYQIGKETADYVVEVLQGRNPADLSARIANGSEIYVNQSAAQKNGITLPRDIVENATNRF